MNNRQKSPVKPVISYMLKTAWKEKPVLFFIYLLQFVTNLIQKFQAIIVPKFMIDELVAIYNGAELTIHIRNAIIFASIAVLLQFLCNIFNSIVNRVRGLCAEYFDEYFMVKVNDYAMNLDFELTEDPQALNQLSKAKEGMSWYSGNVCGILDQFFSIIGNIAVVAGVIAVVCTKSPLLLPLEAVSIGITALFNRKIRQIELKSFEGLSKSNRIFSYLFNDLSNFKYGKDIRLYNSSKLFSEKTGTHLDNQIKIWKTQAEGTKKQQYCINFVNAVTNFFVYFYLGYLAIKRLISIGDFSMCLSSNNTLTTSFQQIVTSFQEILKRSHYAEEYLKFLDYPQAIPKGTKAAENQTNHIIEFRNVSFKYPRAEEYVLKNINITIPSGQHLAVVGLNGAGKTTFIKLLCRLYDVTEGSILIDGINIKEYSEEEYRKLFAVLFQDFKIFAFSLKENISFNPDAENEKVIQALKTAGLYEYAQTLKKGLDTCIDKSFDKHGTDFSGGQKQKVGIARTLYKNAPIIILDEPTAALDPIAEAEIYSTFNTSVAGGKTAIYISHRLSSCKFCDKIAVFSSNTITEYGNHEELMSLPDGVYHKMFSTQAKQYQKA